MKNIKIFRANIVLMLLFGCNFLCGMLQKCRNFVASFYAQQAHEENANPWPEGKEWEQDSWRNEANAFDPLSKKYTKDLLNGNTCSHATEEKKVGMSIKAAIDLRKTIWLHQKQACVLNKNDENFPFNKLFTPNLNPCIGLAIDSKNKIGLIHIDYETKFESVSKFIVDNFDATEDSPIKLYFGASSATSSEIWDEALWKQGVMYGFKNQEERLECLQKKIQEYARSHNKTILVMKVVNSPATDLSANLTYLNTLGISKKGPFLQKIYPDEYRSPVQWYALRKKQLKDYALGEHYRFLIDWRNFFLRQWLEVIKTELRFYWLWPYQMAENLDIVDISKITTDRTKWTHIFPSNHWPMMKKN